MNYTICLYDLEGLGQTQSILISPILSGMSVSDRVNTWLAEREQQGHMSALFPFLFFSPLVCHSFCFHLFVIQCSHEHVLDNVCLLKKKKKSTVKWILLLLFDSSLSIHMNKLVSLSLVNYEHVSHAHPGVASLLIHEINLAMKVREQPSRSSTPFHAASKEIPPLHSSQFRALVFKIFERWDVLLSHRCLSFTFPSQTSSLPLLFPLPCYPHVSPLPALFCLPVLPQSSFHSCPPPLPFPFLSSAAVLFSLFLSSFTSMASGSWLKRCRTEPTGGWCTWLQAPTSCSTY